MSQYSDSYDGLRADVWAAAKARIAEDGWTQAMLESAAEDAGADAALMMLAFPDGPSDLLAYASQESDAALLRALEEMDMAEMRIRDKITNAVRLRIEGMADHRDVVKRSMAFLALPQNALLGTKLLYGTCDTIWYGIGDTSTDFNFYTKRMSLAGVYSSTVLYWLSDDSEGFKETWAFLDRRIENVMEFEKCKASVLKFVDSLPTPFSAAR